MPVPLLIVELPASDAGRPEAAMLVEACSSGLPAGRCEMQRGATGDPATAVGVVAWRGEERLNAVVEVGHRNASGDSWLSEELTFQPHDAIAERYRALGLTLASLFRELAAPDSDAPPRDAKPEPRSPQENRDEPRPAPAFKPGNSRGLATASGLSASLGGLAAGDSELGSVRWGARASLDWRAARVPLSITASGRFARATPASLTLNWWTLGLGAAWSQALAGPFAARVRVEGVAERVAASADDAAGNAQTKHHWVGGARLGLDGLWRGGEFWALAANLEFTQLASRTSVTVRRAPVLVAGATSLATGLSFEIRPFEAF